MNLRWWKDRSDDWKSGEGFKKYQRLLAIGFGNSAERLLGLSIESQAHWLGTDIQRLFLFWVNKIV